MIQYLPLMLQAAQMLQGAQGGNEVQGPMPTNQPQPQNNNITMDNMPTNMRWELISQMLKGQPAQQGQQSIQPMRDPNHISMPMPMQQMSNRPLGMLMPENQANQMLRRSPLRGGY